MEKFTDIYFGVSGAAEVVIGCHYFGRFAGKNILGKRAAAVIVLAVMQSCFGAANAAVGAFSGFIIGKNPDVTAAAMIIINLLSLFSVCACCEIILKKYAVKTDGGAKIAAEIILPAAVFLSGFYVNRVIFGDMVSEKTLGEIFRQSPILLALQVLGIAAVFCTVRLRREIIGKNTEAELAESRAEKAELRCEKTRAFRHDLNRHMLVLSGLLSQGDINGAKKYLSEIKAVGEELSAKFKTGDPTADIILNKRLSEAEGSGIRVYCEMKIPRCKMEAFDLCVILANAVDNAVCACERLGEDAEKFIEIRGGIQGNILLIEIKNSFDGKNFKKGVGLKNIEAAAEKYRGSAKIFREKNTVTLRIFADISHH